MKTLILFLFAIALPLFGGAAKSVDEKAVVAAQQQWADSMVKADIAALEKLLGDDLTYTHSSAKTETKAEVIQAVKSGSPKYVSITFKDTKVRQYGNVVITTQNATITTAPSTANKLYLTLVWAKQPGGWQLVSRQATKLPE